MVSMQTTAQHCDTVMPKNALDVCARTRATGAGDLRLGEQRAAWRLSGGNLTRHAGEANEPRLSKLLLKAISVVFPQELFMAF